MTTTLQQRSNANVWDRFCEWVTSTDNRIYVGWFGVLTIPPLMVTSPPTRAKVRPGDTAKPSPPSGNVPELPSPVTRISPLERLPPVTRLMILPMSALLLKKAVLPLPRLNSRKLWKRLVPLRVHPSIIIVLPLGVAVVFLGRVASGMIWADAAVAVSIQRRMLVEVDWRLLVMVPIEGFFCVKCVSGSKESSRLFSETRFLAGIVFSQLLLLLAYSRLMGNQK